MAQPKSKKTILKRIYCDYASLTPLDPRVLSSMLPYMKDHFHNPSSLYEEGRMAREVIDESRKTIAHILQAKADEIFFTSGGTEANNIAIQGVLKLHEGKKVHMITSAIEHSSILEICKYFETKGVDVTYIPVGEDGIASPNEVVKALKSNTVLISLMYGNNEIGTINNISKISKDVKKYRKDHNLEHVILHTDASQGACYLNMRTDFLGVDMITCDGSKFYGPRGSGFLYKKRGIQLAPLIFGGGHEEGIRPGTENTASIVGLAKALEICDQERKTEVERLQELRDYAFDRLLGEIPGLMVNGSRTERLPNSINVCITNAETSDTIPIDSEFLVIKLDLLGIACSSVTTCKNLMDDSSSYVIDELYKNNAQYSNCSKSSLRISLGRFTTKSDVDKALKIIIKTILDSRKKRV